MPPPHAAIPTLIEAIAIISHKVLPSLRLRRDPMTSMPPRGSSTAAVPKLKLSGRDAGVCMETIAVISVVLVADNVTDGGEIEQLT